MRNPNDPHSPDDPAFADRIRRGLAASATGLPDPAGPAHASHRAHDRRRHRRALAGAVGAVALISGVTAVTLQGPDDTGLSTASDSAAIDADGAELDWSVTDDGLSMVSATADTVDGGLYALSTAPGTRYADYPAGNAPKALYRLGDDGRWAPIALGEDEPAISSFSQQGSTLYALSTAPETGEPQGSISADGGETWSTIGLGTVEPPSDDVAWGLSYRVGVASTDDATVAVVDPVFSVPAEDLFPELQEEETPDGSNYSWDQTDEGVSLVEWEATTADDPSSSTASGLQDPESEERASTVIRTVTWAELGVDGPEALSGTTSMYLVEGEAWNPVDQPPAPAASTVSTIQAAGDELVLTQTVYADDGTEETDAHRSTDGRSWTPVALPAPGGQLVPVGDAALAHLSSDPGDSQQTLRVSRDGGVTWDVVDIASLDERIDGGDDGALDTEEQWAIVSGGPLGLAITLNIPEGDGLRSLLLFSEDLQSWSVTDLGEVSRDSVSGFGPAIVGTDRIVVPAHGRPGDRDTPGETMTVIGTPVRG